MAVNNISSQKTIEQIINSTASKASERNTGELGKNDFLNLLVTQLRYQDPLKPVDDKEFIAQMAQFSSLEQMQNMNSTISQSQAYSLIGKRVVGSFVDESTKETKTVEGEVTNVKVDHGKTFVVVKGKDIPLDKVTDISESARSSQTNLSTFTNLIGTTVEGCVYNPETGEIVGVNGLVKSISKGLYEDYAMMDGVEVDISQVITDHPSTNPNFTRDYLSQNTGKEVTVEVIDRISGQKVSVKAVLNNYSIDAEGNIKAVLDQMAVPVESVTNITKIQRENISAYTNLIGYVAKGSIQGGKVTDLIPVDGLVKSIIAGDSDNYAIMDGVSVEVIRIKDEEAADQASLQAALHASQGKEVALTIKNGAKTASVKAILVDGSVSNVNGIIKVKLNDLKVPVNSITEIRPSV